MTETEKRTEFLPHAPASPVYITGGCTVVGHEEMRGSLGRYFTVSDPKDDLFGMETWEQAEAQMQRLALGGALKEAPFSASDVDFMFAGDLLNQCAASEYGLAEFDIPFFGLYGACSICAEGLALAALVSGSTGKRCAAVTSSHNCSAERQFRSPVEYGGQRTPTSQWTVTGAAAFLLGTDAAETVPGGRRVRVADVFPGIVKDMGITDINNMGAAMAPAAADTVLRYFRATGTDASDYDLILTGDLGREGSEIFCELTALEGMPVKERHRDCGLLIYDESTDKHAGGSGCGCSAVVLEAYIIPEMRRGKYGNVLFIGTGALMNPTMLSQGMSIPAIAHLVHLKVD